MKFIEIDKNVFAVVSHFKSDDKSHETNTIIVRLLHGFTVYEDSGFMGGKMKSESYCNDVRLVETLERVIGGYHRMKAYKKSELIKSMQIVVEEDATI